MRYFSVLLLSLCTMFVAARVPMSLLLGRFEPATHPAFVAVDTAVSDGSEMWIRRETYLAFLAMRDSALCDSIDLRIVSATRTYDRQRLIWEHKWDTARGTAAERCLNILRYSSMPGTSRHHWGTDIDLCSVEDSVWQQPDYQRVLAWLELNACRFGFFMPYTDDAARTGYHYEPWHWSYFPLACLYEREYRAMVRYKHIYGFRGAGVAARLDIINKYVFGIGAYSADCLENKVE